MFSFHFLKSIFLCLVLAAVRRNQLTRNAPDNDLETCIRKWLEGSGDRSGGRRERLQLRLSSANPRWVLSRKRWGVRLIPDQGFFFLLHYVFIYHCTENQAPRLEKHSHDCFDFRAPVSEGGGDRRDRDRFSRSSNAEWVLSRKTWCAYIQFIWPLITELKLS